MLKKKTSHFQIVLFVQKLSKKIFFPISKPLFEVESLALPVGHLYPTINNINISFLFYPLHAQKDAMFCYKKHIQTTADTQSISSLSSSLQYTHIQQVNNLKVVQSPKKTGRKPIIIRRDGLRSVLGVSAAVKRKKKILFFFQFIYQKTLPQPPLQPKQPSVRDLITFYLISGSTTAIIMLFSWTIR